MFHNPMSADAVKLIQAVVGELCSPASFGGLYHRGNRGIPMPSVRELSEIVEDLRGVLFPGYFGETHLRPETMSYYVGSKIESIFRRLSEQIRLGFCFECQSGDGGAACENCEERAQNLTAQFIEALPKIRHYLSTDVAAAYEGDPAAKSAGEAIFCYPSIRALCNQRVAKELYDLEAPLIPRIITELAHSETGIDIHPGATIGEAFFMDHGTGVVIGETAVIGKNVRIYQGVTLGAKSFPLDENGNPIKGIPRHPLVEDDVIIYSGATILGRITIGKGAVIGGNVWLTRDVPPGGKALVGRIDEQGFDLGGGI